MSTVRNVLKAQFATLAFKIRARKVTVRSCQLRQRTVSVTGYPLNLCDYILKISHFLNLSSADS
jgi:hypothetical protein